MSFLTELLSFDCEEYFSLWDVPLQFAGGIVGVLLGYYIIKKIMKPDSRQSNNFCICFGFCFSETLIIIRKLLQFFIDFYAGTNILNWDFVSDDHWLFKVFGFAKSPWEQRPLMDMGEDFSVATVACLFCTLGLFLRGGFKVKGEAVLVKKSRKSIGEWLGEKISAEKQKLKNDTNTADWVLWWCIRSVMIYAFITMENRAEANLLGVNLLGTFAVSALHMLSPSQSFLCRISYRVQSLLSVIVFLGSYCGNYVFIYNIISRYDLFLHFVSGSLSAAAGYYIARNFINVRTRKDIMLTVSFALTFSLMIIPLHEMVEFIGDFIWGTSNQGFYWGPSDSSFFFKVFGHGAGNTQLYYLFDTMYDALLASSSAAVTVAVMALSLIKRRVKNSSELYTEKSDSQLLTIK